MSLITCVGWNGCHIVCIELTQFPRTAKSHGQYHELRAAKQRDRAAKRRDSVGEWNGWNGLTMAVSEMGEMGWQWLSQSYVCIELTQFPRTAKSHGQYHELRAAKQRDRAAKRRGDSVGEWNGLTMAVSEMGEMGWQWLSQSYVCTAICIGWKYTEKTFQQDSSLVNKVACKRSLYMLLI